MDYCKTVYSICNFYIVYVKFRQQENRKDEPIARPVGAVRLRSDQGRDSGKYICFIPLFLLIKYTHVT
jgi:hypothetical protein